MSILLFLPALALSTVTGMNVYVCIAVMGVICTIYTVMGGIEAVIWTDVLQVIVLLGGAIIALCIMASKVDGGFSGMITIANSYDKLHQFNWTWDYTVASVWVVLVGGAMMTLFPHTAD